MHECAKEKEKFDRIYMSNVPDYTGLLPAYLNFLPLLKDVPHALLDASIMMATVLYQNLEQYIWSATRLRNAKEVESILGVEWLDGELFTGMTY
jgi:hypothetical protein